MIAVLNQVLGYIEEHLTEEIDVAGSATASDWFPSNPWRLRPGPSVVAILERAADFSAATSELWLPVERT